MLVGLSPRVCTKRQVKNYLIRIQCLVGKILGGTVVARKETNFTEYFERKTK